MTYRVSEKESCVGHNGSPTRERVARGGDVTMDNGGKEL